jgi:hypothetical protein
MLNNLTSQLKEEIKQLKNDTINEYLKELTIDSSTEYSLWKNNQKSQKTNYADTSYQEIEW